MRICIVGCFLMLIFFALTHCAKENKYIDKPAITIKYSIICDTVVNSGYANFPYEKVKICINPFDPINYKYFISSKDEDFVFNSGVYKVNEKKELDKSTFNLTSDSSIYYFPSTTTAIYLTYCNSLNCEIKKFSFGDSIFTLQWNISVQENIYDYKLYFAIQYDTIHQNVIDSNIFKTPVEFYNSIIKLNTKNLKTKLLLGFPYYYKLVYHTDNGIPKTFIKSFNLMNFNRVNFDY